MATPIMGTAILTNIPNANLSTDGYTVSSGTTFDNCGHLLSSLGEYVLECSTGVSSSATFSTSNQLLYNTTSPASNNFQSVNYNPNNFIIVYNAEAATFYFYYVNPSTGTLSSINVYTSGGTISNPANSYTIPPSTGTLSAVCSVGCFDSNNNFYFFDAGFLVAGQSPPSPTPTFFKLSLVLANQGQSSMTITVSFLSCLIGSIFTPPTSTTIIATYGYGTLSYYNGLLLYCGGNGTASNNVLFSAVVNSGVLTLRLVSPTFLTGLPTTSFVNYAVFDPVNLNVYALVNNQVIYKYNLYTSYSSGSQGVLSTSGQTVFFNTNMTNSVYMLGLNQTTLDLYYSVYFVTYTSSVQNVGSTLSTTSLTGVLFNYPLTTTTTGGTTGDTTGGGGDMLMSNICFTADTVVETDQGNVWIPYLLPHHHTLDGEPILGVTRTRYSDKHLVRFERDALELGVPNRETVMTMDHQICVEDGKWVMASQFVDVYEGVTLVEYSAGDILYNVLLKHHGHMKVHNMTVETLHPDNLVSKLYLTPWIAPYRNALVFELNSCIDNYDMLTYNLVRRQLRVLLDDAEDNTEKKKSLKQKRVALVGLLAKEKQLGEHFD